MATVVIRVTQDDGDGFEVTKGTDARALPAKDQRKEAARLPVAAFAASSRHLQPELSRELEPLRELLREMDGESS